MHTDRKSGLNRGRLDAMKATQFHAVNGIQLIGIHDDTLKEFLHGMNSAFENRKTDRIPYHPMSLNELQQEISDGAVFMGCYEADASSMCGGIRFQIIDDHTVKIKHVWVAPHCQGRGIARRMLQLLEDSLQQQGIECFSLSVAHNYLPAVKLYQNCGYRVVNVYANAPHTYHFLDMEHRVSTNFCTEAKRYARLFTSYLKFFLLFHSDSTPKFLHRSLFSNKKS